LESGVEGLEIEAWDLVFRVCDLGLRERLVIKVEPKEQFLTNIMGLEHNTWRLVFAVYS
jgi:hypothetical protein